MQLNRNDIFYIRFFYDIALCAGFFFLPWWVLFTLLIIGVLFFKSFLEMPLFLLGVDMLYAVPSIALFDFPFFYTVLGCVLLAISTFIRARIRV